MATVFVSGATGFIASHTISQLLAGGHRVRASVRDLGNTVSLSFLRGMSGAAGRLELVQADLRAQDAFAGQLGGCEFVLHTASPYVLDAKDPQRDLVDPAVQGTRAMLEACRETPGVKRVVLTSSIAAITDEPLPNRIFTEDHWNVRSTLTRNPYYLSKTMAERDAWSFVRDRRPSWDLVVVNPSIVIGRSMTKALNTSNGIIAGLLNGAYPAVVSLTWPLVDVRDVADAHIRAMATPAASGRYICSADSVTARHVAELLKANGYDHYRLPRLGLDHRMGDVVVKLASHLQPAGVGQYLRTHVGAPLLVDNSRIRRDLSMTFRPLDPAILEAAADLVAWGHVRPRQP